MHTHMHTHPYTYTYTHTHNVHTQHAYIRTQGINAKFVELRPPPPVAYLHIHIHTHMYTFPMQLVACNDLLIESIEGILSNIDSVSLAASTQRAPLGAAAAGLEGGCKGLGIDTIESETQRRIETSSVVSKSAPGGGVKPQVVFSGFRERVLETVRERFEIVRSLNVTFARSLAKYVFSLSFLRPCLSLPFSLAVRVCECVCVHTRCWERNALGGKCTWHFSYR